MRADMDAAGWVTFVETAYLREFIADGGASIKFAVSADDDVRDDAVARLLVSAARNGYLTANVDAAVTKFHMIDDIFFAISRQIPWRELAREYVISLAADNGYGFGTGQPPAVSIPLAAALAESNDLDPQFLRTELVRLITRTLYRDNSMSKDFRTAMVQMCIAELTGTDDEHDRRTAITEWITGEMRWITHIKPYGIFTRINRNNARYLLESLMVWVRRAGRTGVVVLMDVRQLSVPRRPAEGLFYTKSLGLLDAYEVLRQFIDGTDRLTGCLLVILPAPEFLDIEAGSRGIGAYSALANRVYDEIRDRRLPNPMGALIRLTGAAPQEATAWTA